MLKIEPGKRMKKEFRLYKDSEIFRDKPDGSNLIREKKLIDHDVDDDFDTDEDSVEAMRARCKKELREAIRNFCTVDNPFELVRNIRDPDSETGILPQLTPSKEPSLSKSSPNESDSSCSQ